MHLQNLRMPVVRVVAAIAIASCGNGDPQEPPLQKVDRCTLPQGEFIPSDCALLRGIARAENGQPLAGGIPIRVDSVIRGVAYIYASNTAWTAPDGSFTLEVSRIARLRPPTTPDTATVELKTYGTPNPKAGGTPTARAPVLMYFAVVGHVVMATIVDPIFVSYP